MNFDRTCPEVPEEIIADVESLPQYYFDVCFSLWSEVIEEVLDREFIKRAHQNVGTYDQGCRGPLCRKALREHPRRKSPAGTALQLREERVYDPVIEYFYVVAKHRIRIAQQEILKELA